MIYADYIHTKKVNLDLNKIRQSCFVMQDYICSTFSNQTKYYTGESTLTTQLFLNYNLLMYPKPGFHQLYSEIKNFFYEVYDGTYESFYMQSWLNFYNKDDFIDWHSHWPKEKESWHGFFCVDCGENMSGTLYRIMDVQNEIFVPSENNLLVISKSEKDIHKSTEWLDERNPRITIAFDIIPDKHIDVNLPNHWIPI